MQLRYSLFLFLGLLLLSLSCSSSKENEDESDEIESLDQRQQIKLKQYMSEGLRLYVLHCSNCHQKDGSGLARLIPPLAASDYLAESIERSVCIIKNGIDEGIMVSGVSYQQPMPGNSNLTNIEVAEIATYIHNKWGTQKGIVEVKTVDKVDCN